MPVIAVLGAVLLIAVFLVRPGRRANLWVFVGFLLVVPIVFTHLVGIVLGRTGPVYPEAESEKLLRGVVPELQRVANDPPEHVVIIEGASWAARGIVGPQLESELKEKGVDAAVIQVTLPGANHFERDYILRQLASALNRRRTENLSNVEVLLLREISQGYLENPIAQLDRNAYTDRVYAYATPTRAFAMGRAAFTSGRLTLRVAAQIAQHAAFNWMRIGELRRLETPRDHAAMAGYMPLDTTNEDMSTQAISEIIRYVRSNDRPTFAQPPWIGVLRRMNEGSFGLPVDSTMWLETPTLRLSSSRYARWMSSETSDASIVLDEVGLYRALDDVDLWHDTGHLRREGAEIYTAWLAGRVADAIQAQA